MARRGTDSFGCPGGRARGSVLRRGFHQGRAPACAGRDGRLLCDEGGMGKTIEAILILRRLMAGRGVRRALLLVPAESFGSFKARADEPKMDWTKWDWANDPAGAGKGLHWKAKDKK